MRRIISPLTKKSRKKLRCGERVLLTGTIYTARDAVHKKLSRLLANKKRLPFAIKDAVIYYAGPTPAREDGLFGSCGPTTSSRMDGFTPLLLKNGIAAMIGKGGRSDEVRRAIQKHGAIYFLAAGGAGAYLAKRILSCKAVAFRELGAEGIYELEVADFPLIVGIDSKGRDIYGGNK